MDKHLIITVHGMGDVGDNWGKENVEKVLEEAYNLYPSLQRTGTFEDRFSFHHINYNQYFEQNLKRKRDQQIQLANLSQRAESLISGFSDATQKLFKLHQLDLGKDNFWATHFGDVFLYLVDDHVRGQVNAAVQAELVRAFHQHLDTTRGHGRCSLIAHSLGTAVTTTALQQLYSDDTSVLHKLGKLKTLITLANVANLASVISGESVYDNMVHPSASKFDGVCYHYINSWHALDPFTLVRRFRPDKTQWNRTAGDPDMNDHVYIERPLALRHVQQKNVHALAHYLSHPDVHLTLFQYLERDPGLKSIVPAEERDAAEKRWLNATLWKQLATTIGAAESGARTALQQTRDKLDEIISSTDTNDADDLIEAVDEVKALLESARDSLASSLPTLKSRLTQIIDQFWS